MDEHNIIFISEVKHIEEIPTLLIAHPDIQRDGYILIPLDVEIEYSLAEKKIPFKSGRGYRTQDVTPLILSEAWPMDIFNDEQWSFFQYRGVSLSRLYFLSLQAYLMALLYYTDIIANVSIQHPATLRFVVFPPTNAAPPTGFPLEGHRIMALADVVTSIALQSNRKVLVPGLEVSAHIQTNPTHFTVKRRLFGLCVGLSNILISFMRRPRRIRILASDYWYNLEPYLKRIDSVEVFLLDRMQMFNAGILNIWKFRMRFVHLDAYGEKKSLDIDTARKNITKKWQSIKDISAMPELTFRNFSMRPIVMRALDTIIADTVAHALKDIDDTYVLCACLKPDVIELRTTISTQTHFTILAQVARVLGIPSLEMQHGLEYYGPGSTDRCHSAEHMGVYGPLTERELHVAGDTITMHVIGSPRFDVYAALHEKNCVKRSDFRTRISVLCLAPTIVVGVATDSYDVEEYFSVVASAVRDMPNVVVVVKLRPGPMRQSFYETIIARVFAGVSHCIAQFEPLAELYSQSDIVVSCYSTAMLEALQCGKPLIYLGLSAGYKLMGQYHLAAYAEKGVLAIATTQTEFQQTFTMLTESEEARERMSRAAVAFLEKEYAFDGNASERAAALITYLAHSKPRQELS